MNKRPPKISIICVTFNAENHILLTLNSIKDQIFKDFELIIIDGVSKDSTLQLIENFNIEAKIVSEPDTGIYDAMNKGVDFADGEWIFFLNAGDVFTSINTLSDVFSKSLNGSILYGDTLLKTDNYISYCPTIINKNFFFSNTICLQSIFINKSVFINIGRFDLFYKVIADRDFLIKAHLYGESFEHVNEVISIYDQEGFSFQNHKLYLKEQNILRNIYFSYFDFIKHALLKIKKILSKPHKYA